MIFHNRFPFAFILLMLVWILPGDLIGQDHGELKAHLIAHRGGVVDEQRAENSASAIREAVERGYWMLEVDLRKSGDGDEFIA